MHASALVAERDRLEVSLKYTEAALEVCDDGAREDLLQWQAALLKRLKAINDELASGTA